MTTVTGMLTLILQLGITMLVPIVVCTIGGNWLGVRLGWMGFPVLGFVVGATAGMQGAWKLIRRMTADWPDSPVSQAGLAQAAKAAQFADGKRPEEAVRDAGFTDGRKPDEPVRETGLTDSLQQDAAVRATQLTDAPTPGGEAGAGRSRQAGTMEGDSQ